MKKKIAVLFSGRGSNMLALHEATKNPSYPAEIVMTVTDRPDAQGIEKAQALGLPCRMLDATKFDDTQSFESNLHHILVTSQVEYICLAGFMRILSSWFVEKWKGKIVNIHPSLLPNFIGLKTHERALKEKVLEHGCSVHFVTPDLDKGPIIGQAKLNIENENCVKRVAERVLEAEHIIYPHALSLVASGLLSVDNTQASFMISPTV